MERSASRIDELRHFFLAENRGQAMTLFGVGSVGDTPRPFQRLDVEKTEGTEMVGYGTSRQLPFREEVGLVLPNVLPSQAIGRAVKMSSERFDLANIVACGSLRVMTALEFLQHDFS
jgi:hypothetical protein